LVGYGLAALLSRALYARGAGRAAATGTVLGWLSVVVADVVLVAAFPDVDRVLLLGVGSSVGLTVGGLWLLAALGRSAGTAAVSGAGRTAVGATVAALVAVAAGLALVTALPLDVDGSVGQALVAAVLVTAAAGGVHLLVVRLLDPAGVRELAGTRP
jgi:putative peptidoglycan lipid II flippase